MFPSRDSWTKLKGKGPIRLRTRKQRSPMLPHRRIPEGERSQTMLDIILSHWRVYLYLFYMIILAMFFFASRDRSAPSRDSQQARTSLTSGQVVAATRIV